MVKPKRKRRATSGEARPRLSSAQEQFLRKLFKRYGGAGKVAHLLTLISGRPFNRFDICNWQRRGVPLEYVITVGRALDVSPYALNHIDVSEMTGKQVEWEEATKQKFDENTVQILQRS